MRISTLEKCGNKSLLKRILNSVADMFFPPRCVFCGEVILNGYICENCTDKYIPHIIVREKEGYRIITVADYDDFISPVVYSAKRNRDGRAIDFMATEIGKAALLHGEYDLTIPVPMYKGDKSKRGYNQTEKLCQTIREEYGIPCYDFLIKTRKTAQQKTLGKKGRKENLKGSYALKKNTSLKGKSILIVDDVSTTGTTFKEIYKIIKNEGAKSITCIAFAHPTHKD